MCAAPVDQRHRAMPEVDISNAPPGSTFIVVTHDHALDFLLASAALQRGDAAYVGLIGSMSKRAKFKSWCSTNCDNLSMDGLICPIGGTTSSDKRPAVIAAFVAAEVMAKLTTSQHAQPVKSHDAIVAFNKAEHVSPGSKSSGAGL